MPVWSRRRALHALGTTAAAALAGCIGDESGFEEEATNDRGDPVTDYDLRKVRTPQPEQLFWEGERATEREDVRPGGQFYVGSAADLDDVTFADSDRAAELASFARETDFESASVLLRAHTIRECYALRLRGVWREADGLETEFCSTLRPADAACSADAETTVGVGIRLPFPDGEFSSFSSGWSSSCDTRPEPVTAGDGGDGS